jgi:hypothetical protein
MPQPNFTYHKYSVHYGLARLEGGSQVRYFTYFLVFKVDVDEAICLILFGYNAQPSITFLNLLEIGVFRCRKNTGVEEDSRKD